MRVSEWATVAVGVLILAGVAVSFKPGSAAPGVVSAAGTSASTVIKAAAYGK